MIFPEVLRKGDLIGVTATSGGISKEKDILKIENAIKNLDALGYKVIETPNVRMEEKKFVSSSGEERAKEFFELYSNDEIKYIVAASGGEFLMEMLPYLDRYSLKEKKPKWVQGFSDTSLLLFYLTTKYNIATVHGTNFGGYGRKEIHFSYMNSIKAISSNDDFLQESYEMYEATPIYWQEGMEFELPRPDTKVIYKNLYGEDAVSFSGRLIGGCADVLRTIIGTPYDYVKTFCSGFKSGMIWYLENCEMSVADFYRTLWQMREAGWFKNANGILIGRTRANESMKDFSYEDVLHFAFDGLNVPVIYDVDFGHVELQWTMINGAFAEFEYANEKGKLNTKFM